MRALRILFASSLALAKWAILAYACLRAYRIRRHAVDTFGMVIHEFDPWFNYRATEYLAEHGASKFFKWYDYQSWYPLGRPIGTTIYPGMQFASIWIWEALKLFPEGETKYRTPKQYLDMVPKWLQAYFPNKMKGLSFGPMSLNDVCCMVPGWFGSVATFLTYLFTAEISESSTAGVIAACIMSIIPAHMMRSSTGEFDNEAVAVSAFCLTLWLWCRCIRTRSSWPWAIPAGIAYAAAASTWGGYIFINNLITIHCLVFVFLGKFSETYRAFTVFYIVGTFLTIQVPVIGYTPLRSVEQMPSVLGFGCYQVMAVCDAIKARKKMSAWQFCFFRVGVFAAAATAAGGVAFILSQMGVFMPLGSRIRGLFLVAVKTGNPLVDSVAEHQPADPQSYAMFLGGAEYIAIIGLAFIWHQGTPGKYLAFIYAIVAYHYSLKMSRLLIICGPIVSVLAAIPGGVILDWCEEQFLGLMCKPSETQVEKLPLRSGGMGSIWRYIWGFVNKTFYPQEMRDILKRKDELYTKAPLMNKLIRGVVAVAIVYAAYTSTEINKQVKAYIEHCDMVAKHFSNPQLMFEHRDKSGKTIIIDDYLRGYEWVRDNTPEDSRVMAWWDYGYQITGVAKRTSIADGNTWNHEHIATLGRVLTSSVPKAHKAVRHLADYILVWAGGHGDDMGKSPHLARIGNSVFPDHCGDDDPLCRKYSFHQDGSPTPMMAQSLLYQAVMHNVQDGVKLSKKYFEEVHTTKHGLMRVFKVLNISQESKDWVDDPKNRICDAPGSWYCVGQYPPALQPLISKRRNFAQLEDFNKVGQKKSAYTNMIEAEMSGGKGEL